MNFRESPTYQHLPHHQVVTSNEQSVQYVTHIREVTTNRTDCNEYGTEVSGDADGPVLVMAMETKQQSKQFGDNPDNNLIRSVEW